MPIMRRLAPLLRILIVVAVLLLVACTSTNGGQGASGSPEPDLQRPAAPVTLTLWHSWSGAKLEALNSLARLYEQEQPDVRIRLEAQPATELIRRYSMSVADGTAPQLLLTLGRYLGDLSERQYVAPLDGLLDEQALASFVPATLDSVRIGDQLYALPIAFDTTVLLYDRSQVPTPPATWDELLALNEADRGLPTTERPYSVGYYLTLETTLPYLPAFGGRLVGDDGALAIAGAGRDATVRWLGWLGELQRNEHVLASSNFSTVDSQIQAGRVRSAIDWGYRRGSYAQVWSDDRLGIAPLPALNPDVPAAPLLLTEVLSINPVASAEQRRAADAFLRYIVAQPAQQTLAERAQVLPANRGATLPATLEPFAAAAANAQPLPPRVASAGVWLPLEDMLRSVVSGGVGAEEAVTTAGAIFPSPSP
jgi:arabinogalactan oligomer / maltooligosaccharide transport system substrate-binding protein